jgi:Flp pilus assembly protein TadG
VEFAMILPLLVLFIIGIFDLGRAFFAYIAITNAAREGARVITFWPGKTKGSDVVNAINSEISTSPMVLPENISGYTIECTTTAGDYQPQPTDDTVLPCLSGGPVKVTVRYNFQFIFNFLFSDSLTLRRSVEMLEP